MPAKHPYLQLNNLPEHFENDATIAIGNWGCAMVFWLRERDGLTLNEADVARADHAAWVGSGLRCHALDFLRDQPSPMLRLGLDALAKIALNIHKPDVLRDSIGELESIRHSLTRLMHWVCVDDFDSLKYDHHLAWRTWPKGAIYLNADLVSTLPPSTLDRDEARAMYRTGTESQRRAMRELIELIRVKKAGVCYSGITPRTTALLIGMSGSGKSWVAATVGAVLNFPIFTTTVGSWTLVGNSTALSTIELLRRHLDAHGASLIVIDEVDKLRQNRTDNLNFFASVWDEIMAVLDGRMQNFGGWERSQIAALAASHFVAAGAFQDIYRSFIGAEVLFEEQLEDLQKIDFGHLSNAQFLPDELLNRLGSVIEIRPPTSSEIAERMTDIEIDAEVAVDPVARLKGAREIAISCLGMRGLEQYALKLARANLSRERAAE